MMKVILCALALLPLAVHALTLQGVIEAADGKLCVYGDHLRT
ncbi:hypothetical protein ENTCAN_06881 [Enterobacter cancerogenus ATCC 35316]|nr:hypothetical protein ENTCAN_06881 [Enterobacter cancerogenus ATCC 35316]